MEIAETGLPSLVWFHRGGRLMRRARGSERNFVVGGLAHGHSVNPTAAMRRVPASKQSPKTDQHVDKSCFDCEWRAGSAGEDVF